MRGKVKEGWPGVLAHYAARIEAQRDEDVSPAERQS